MRVPPAVGYDDDGSSVGESGFDAIGDIAADVKGKGKATSYNVDYSVLSRVDLAREMKKEIDHVASALSLKVRISSLDCWR